MGCGFTKMSEEDADAKKRTKMLNQTLQADKAVDKAVVKLLLLGAGESGKSTIFKQMRMLYGDGYSVEDRKDTRAVIHSNLIVGTLAVLDAADAQEVILEDEVQDARSLLKSTKADDVMTDKLADAITQLWKSATFQSVIQNRSKFQLIESYLAFAKKLASKYPEWGGPEWIPDPEDCLQARVRTSGIVEETFQIDGAKFRMFDVGGQRNERKKWIHCFDSVTAIIFVCAISEYDQVLFEDDSCNRLIEAVDLFEEICNSKWFTETSIILFLNKSDLFKMKFIDKQIPLNTSGLELFASWREPDRSTCSPNDALALAHDWILAKFRERSKDPNREVYHHITCATDTNNVKTVFEACQDIILKNNMKNTGLF